jgi:hypothetical protein
MADTRKRDRKPATKELPLSLHPLSLDEALKGAMQTGKPPEQPKRKRPAAKPRPKKGEKTTVKAVVVALLVTATLMAPSPSLAADAFDALVKAVEDLDAKTRQECNADSACAARQRERDQQAEAARAAQIATAKARDLSAQKLGREPKTIRLGDTGKYVELQWGKPEKIDRMVSAHGTHEWWWYEGLSAAVHFANGRVDSIHTER